MLLHVVLPSEGLVTCGTEDVLLARVFLAMASRVAGGGKGIGAAVPRGMWTRVFFLADFGDAVGWCRGGRSGGRARRDGSLEGG